MNFYPVMHSVFSYYKALVVIFFGHHFLEIYLYQHFLNHILLSLASFDFYCGSFMVYRVAFLVASGAVQAI